MKNDNIIAMIYRKLRKSSMRPFFLSAAMIVMFGVTYSLILPAITAATVHPSLETEETTTLSGELLSVTVRARTPDSEEERVFVLLAESIGDYGAGLEEAISFDEEGIAVITDEAGQEIELHRAARKGAGKNKAEVLDYWFVLPRGEETVFTLNLEDGLDVRALIEESPEYELKKDTKGSIFPVATEEDDNKKDDNSKKEETVKKASSSDAAKKNTGAAAGKNSGKNSGKSSGGKKGTSSNAAKATGSNASGSSKSSGSGKQQKEEETVPETRYDEDGFLMDGEIYNDLPVIADGSVGGGEADGEGHDIPTIVSRLTLKAGSGVNLEKAVRDAERNAEKRGDALRHFSWEENPDIRASARDGVLTFDENGVSVELRYTKEAGIPKNSELAVREILEGSAEYEECLKRAESAVSSEESGRTVKKARFFDIEILFRGEPIEPLAPVQVSINYEDLAPSTPEAAEDPDALKAVHFEEADGDVLPKVLNAEMPEENSVLFEAESFSIYGIIETVIEKRVLAGDGHNYKITVTVGSDAGVPQGAELAVSEILKDEDDLYDSYVSRTAEALGWEAGSVSYIRLFDIKIVDKAGSKVEIKAPVDVKIVLDDMDSSEEVVASTKVVHFADGSETGDIVEQVEAESEGVSFKAEGFSAYAIVAGPDPVPVGWGRISSMEELSEYAETGKGLYIGHPNGFYFRNNTVGDSSRTGIAKTKPASVSPTSAAALYYFEKMEGSEDQYYVYCYSGNKKQYVYNGGNNSLFLKEEPEKTAFTVSVDSSGKFTLRNGAWYWNMQGGDNGNRFCSYNSAGDVNNNLYFWHYADVEEDPYLLDGKSYGLMSWNGGVAGKAMMAESSGNALNARALTVVTKRENFEDKLFVPNDDQITFWKFEWINADNYYISAGEGGEQKYLKITDSGLSLVDSRTDASRIQVIPGSGVHKGEICLKAGDATLTFSGKVETGFSTGGAVGSEWLKFAEESELTKDYVKPYSARKVSVSSKEVTNGSKIIVYAREWNEEKTRYDFYAIDHDGSMVPCFESGDSIEWVGGMVNTLLWNFVEYYAEDNITPTHYYELYNQYSEKYLAPQLHDGGQLLSDDTIGINLNGRKNEQYYTPILAWDDTSYAYACLKVENGSIVPCRSREMMDFYFAIVEDIQVDDDLVEVNTVDSTAAGITMKIADLETRAYMSGILGDNEGGAVTTLRQGLLSTDLGSDGYPVTMYENSSHASLKKLYDEGGVKEVNHLFIESTYNATGYYEFNSAQNYATLLDKTSHKPGDDFRVYKELGSYDSGGNKPTLKHGQFFPYNDLEPGVFASVNGRNLYSATAQLLPDEDPRKNENLYLIKNVDCFFAMELQASFYQTPNGLDDWGHDIIFEFSGDDDFWLYVDGELVIDLGGIHSAVPGNVNFRTGAVLVNKTKTTLRALFEENYRKRKADAGESVTDEEVETYLNGIFEDGGTVFKNGTKHTMRIFYMERGAGASNLHMRFNLSSIKPGTVELSKQLRGVDNTESVMAEFPYQVYYKDKNGVEKQLTNEWPDDPQRNVNNVFYKNQDRAVSFQKDYTVDGIHYQDVFLLRPKEAAIINFPKDMVPENGIVHYRIVECGVNTATYNKVLVDETEITGTLVEGHQNRADFGIGLETTENRPRVPYVNEVNPEVHGTLTFRKKLYNEYGTEEITGDSTPFNFRLYLGTESVPDGELAGANMYTYHVKNPAGEYCWWDEANQCFVSYGKTNYNELTPNEKELASHVTSPNGSITKIPVDYTVEVRELLSGTKYKVEERDYEIPDGYSLQKYVYYENGLPAAGGETGSGEGSGSGESGPGEGSGSGETAQGGQNSADPVSGTIVVGKNPHVDVCNLKGWGLRVNKTWSDADFMAERDPAYFAVFLKQGTAEPVLVENTVRRLLQNEKTLYWYFQTLKQGTGFADYQIYEVALENPVVDQDGNVTGFTSIRPVVEVTIYGKQKSETERKPFEYYVSYERGGLSAEANVRVDEVTNVRNGILIRKEAWDGSADKPGTPLEGAVFTITQGSETIGTFTSDKTGKVTEAFLAANTDYTLTETQAPAGYHGLETPMTIRIENGTPVISGPGEEYYYVIQESSQTGQTGQTAQTIVIRNRPFTFKAVKKDQVTKNPLAGVHFALHEQKTVGDVTIIDLEPMVGYEDLITGEDGVIPKIDNTLKPGVYELREKTALSGYQELGFYIDFKVTPEGAVSLIDNRHPDKVNLQTYYTSEPVSYEPVSYELTILNQQFRKIRFKKVDNANTSKVLEGAVFDLYKRVSGETGSGTGRELLYSGLTSDKNGILVFKKSGEQDRSEFDLPVGNYELVETNPPAGYQAMTAPVTITVSSAADPNAVSYNDGTSYSQSAGKTYDESTKTYTLGITNSSGYALPSSGGSGTGMFHIVGSLLALGAGILLVVRRRMAI